MNTLDNKFKHKRWFLNSNLTNRQVIEYIASHMGDIGDYDFYFKENASGIVVKGLEDGSSWKPNKEQLDYLKERISFYEKYYQSHIGKYDFQNDWSNAIEQKRQDMLNEIPEYRSFEECFDESLQKEKNEYNGLALFQNIGEKPFIVSVSSNYERNKADDNLKNIKEKYKGTNISIITTWIEIKELNKSDIYKRICESYVKTMLSEAIVVNPKNNSIFHVFLSDDAIELNKSQKITFDNFSEYLMNEKSVNVYKSYEDFYNCYVKDFIIQDVKDLGLFNGENGEWDFYITYNDMKNLGLEDIVNKQIGEEFGTTYFKENDNEEEEEL